MPPELCKGVLAGRGDQSVFADDERALTLDPARLLVAVGLDGLGERPRAVNCRLEPALAEPAENHLEVLPWREPSARADYRDRVAVEVDNGEASLAPTGASEYGEPSAACQRRDALRENFAADSIHDDVHSAPVR